MAQIANCQYVRNVINANGGNMGACANPTQIANMEYVVTAFNNNFGEDTIPSQYKTKQIADTDAVKGCLGSLKSILAIPLHATIQWLSRNGKYVGSNTNLPARADGIHKETTAGRAVALYLDDIDTGNQYQFRVTTDYGLSWHNSAWLTGGTGKYAVLAKGMGFTPNYVQRIWFANMGGVYTIGDIFSGAAPSLFWETPSSWTATDMDSAGIVASNDKGYAAWISKKYYFVVGNSSYYGVLNNPFSKAEDPQSVAVGNWLLTGITRVITVGSTLVDGQHCATLQVFNTDGTLYTTITNASMEEGVWCGFLNGIPMFLFRNGSTFTMYKINSSGNVSVVGTVTSPYYMASHNSVPYYLGLLIVVGNKTVYTDATSLSFFDSGVLYPRWLCLMR